jgi:CheY-like chemotaxis protein
MPSFDFITANDRPALLAIDNPEVLTFAKAALVELGFKVHSIETHEEFPTRFSEIPYEVLIIDEAFGGMTENYTLHTLQQMTMTQRRHNVSLLLGASFETLNSMQAFAQSVHAVVNYSELSLLPQLVQKSIADNNLFLQTFRETGKRVVQMRLGQAGA